MRRSGRAGAAGAPAQGAPVVVVATTPGCRHCARAKAALGEAGVAFEEADVSSPQAAGLRVAVASAAGGDRAVPQAFGLGRHLGNADALVAGLGDGALAEELHRAAPPPELPEGVGAALLDLKEAEMGAGPEAAEDTGAELIRGLRQDWRAVGGGGGGRCRERRLCGASAVWRTTLRPARGRCCALASWPGRLLAVLLTSILGLSTARCPLYGLPLERMPP